MSEPFAGDSKIGRSLLHRPEQRFLLWAVPRVPLWISATHLTLASIPISLLIIYFSMLATHNLRWLLAVAGMIALQWLTDSLDGSVGRARKTGLIRWGYYMDHLLDYFFVASVMIGYMILLPDKSKWLFFFIFALIMGFMVNSYLMVAASNKFRVVHSGIGPTEMRLVFMLINIILAVFGKTHLAFSLPYVLGAAFCGLVFIVYKEQKELWRLDMEIKKANSVE